MESVHKQTFGFPDAVPPCNKSHCISIEIWPDGVVAIIRVDRRETGAAIGCRCYGGPRDCPDSDAIMRGYMFSAAKGKYMNAAVIQPPSSYADALRNIERGIAETRRQWSVMAGRADGRYAAFNIPPGGVRMCDNDCLHSKACDVDFNERQEDSNAD